MKRLLLIGLVLVVGGWWHRVPLNGKPVSVTYTGPGDIVSGATVWYGLRAYTGTIAAGGAQKLINLRRASDNETCDVLVATNGGLGLTTACSGADNGVSVATFLTSTTGFVTELYDQSGNGFNVTQATTAAQPQLLLTGCTSGSLPCMKFVAASSQFLSGRTGGNLSQPFTYSAAANYVSGSCVTAVCEIITNNFASSGAVFTFVPGDVDIFSGTHLSATAVATTWHAVQAVFNNASSGVSVDGTTTSGAAGSAGALNAIDVGGIEGGGGQYLDGEFVEGGLWTVAFSGANITAMNSNQHSYWGF